MRTLHLLALLTLAACSGTAATTVPDSVTSDSPTVGGVTPGQPDSGQTCPNVGAVDGGDAAPEASTLPSQDAAPEAEAGLTAGEVQVQQMCYGYGHTSSQYGTSYAGECDADAGGTCATKWDILGDAGPNPPVCCCPATDSGM